MKSEGSSIGSVLVDCPCGNPIELVVTVGDMTTLKGGRILMKVRTPGSEQRIDWHIRRFHGGKDDVPLPVAA